MPKQLTIAIDFDDTFTSDPATWSDVIEVLQHAGHRVVCVSARRDCIEHRQELMVALPNGVAVLLSYDTPKREFARRHGVNVDIWIDDMPEAIPTREEVLRMA